MITTKLLIPLKKLCIALINLQLHKYSIKISLCDANTQHRHLYIFLLFNRSQNTLAFHFIFFNENVLIDVERYIINYMYMIPISRNIQSLQITLNVRIISYQKNMQQLLLDKFGTIRVIIKFRADMRKSITLYSLIKYVRNLEISTKILPNVIRRA